MTDEISLGQVQGTCSNLFTHSCPFWFEDGVLMTDNYDHYSLSLSVLLAQNHLNGDLGRDSETSITTLFFYNNPFLLYSNESLKPT